MSVPLNLIAAVPADDIADSRRMARFTEQVANALNALIASTTLNQTGSNAWAIDPNALPPSGVIAGVYTNPTITVNTQGLLTQATSGSAVTTILEDGSALTQREKLNFGTALTASDDAGNSRTNVVLANTAVTPNTYTNATVTVDAQGRITSAANGSASGISPLTTKGDIWAYSTLDARFPAAVGDAAIIIQDAAATFGFKWVAVSGDVTITTAGAVTIANDAVTFAKMLNATGASVLVGRGAGSGGGDFQELTLGTGLTLTTTVLSCNGAIPGAGDAPSVLWPPGLLSTNTTSIATLTSTHTFYFYLGKAKGNWTSITLMYRITRAVSGTTWAEMGIYTGAVVIGGNPTLTRRGYNDMSAVWNTATIKTTTITLTGVSAGDDLWVAIGNQATTTIQYQASSVLDNIGFGTIADAIERISTTSSSTPTIAVGGAWFWVIGQGS